MHASIRERLILTRRIFTSRRKYACVCGKEKKEEEEDEEEEEEEEEQNEEEERGA